MPAPDTLSERVRDALVDGLLAAGVPPAHFPPLDATIERVLEALAEYVVDRATVLGGAAAVELVTRAETHETAEALLEDLETIRDLAGRRHHA